MDFMSYFAKYKEEYKTNVQKAPTYIAHFLPNVDNIVLVYKRGQQPVSCSPKLRTKTESSIIDLTGSPLKMDADLTISEDIYVKNENLWLKQEEAHHPMTIEKARMFTNAYNLLPKSINVFGLFCVCDARDDAHTVLLGSSLNDDIFARHLVSVQGFRWRSEKTMQISVFLAKHDSVVQKLVRSEVKKTILVESCYEIFGTSYLTDDNSVAEIATCNGSVGLKVFWKTPSYVPQGDVDSTLLTLQVVVGHANSEAILISSEIELLQTFIDLVEEYEMTADIALPNSTNEGPPVLSQIQQLLQQTNVDQWRKLARSKSPNTDDLRTSVSKTYARSSRDFTDVLWEILSRCASIRELTDCFHYIFQEISSSHCNPYVCHENETSVATFINDAAKGRGLVRCLAGCEPLELLIEMGIEKVIKDFKNICLECNLPMIHFLKPKSFYQSRLASRKSIFNQTFGKMSVNYLERKSKINLLTPRSSIFSNQMINRSGCLKATQVPNKLAIFNLQMTLLGQISTVLEFLLLVNIHMSQLSKSLLVSLVDAVTAHFMGEHSPILSFPELQAAPIHTFRFTLPGRAVASFYSQTSNYWKLSVSSELSKSEGLTTVYHQSRKPIFPLNIYSPKDPIDPQDLSEENPAYFCSEYLYIWNKFH